MIITVIVCIYCQSGHYWQNRTFGTLCVHCHVLWKIRAQTFNDLYCSPGIVRVIKSRRLRWESYVARMGKERGVYRSLVGKVEEKRPHGLPRRRWKDNIKMDLQ
jgi:hypothetical protein